MQPADDTPQHLSSVLEQLLRLTRQIAQTGQLSFTAASVVAWLAREGPQRLTDLADREAVTQPAMTQLVSRLERDGLVQRGTSATDGRATVVSVTDAGRDVVERRRAERAQTFEKLLAQLSAEDRASINAAIPALVRLVEQVPAASRGTAQVGAQP